MKGEDEYDVAKGGRPDKLLGIGCFEKLSDEGDAGV